MYFTQIIDVNLTPENTQALTQPSKIFNKMKAIVVGGMTPAESKRAEVMLSVLQRINRAFRACHIENMRRLSINGEHIYIDHEGRDKDFQVGVESFINAHQNEEFKNIRHLELIAESTIKELYFVFDIQVLKTPKPGRPPVTINVLGFLSRFCLDAGESEDALSARVAQHMRRHLKTKTKMNRFVKSHETFFKQTVDKVSEQINSYFPGGISSYDPTRNVTNKNKSKSRGSDFYSHHQSNVLYLDMWMDHVENCTDVSPDVFVSDNGIQYNEVCIADTQNNSQDNSDTGSDNSWVRDVLTSGDSGSGHSSASCSSSASCGSSCGSSCGGGGCGS